MTFSRILRVLALAAAVAIPATLVGAAPASAADHFVVDNDGITLAQTNATGKVFDGNMQSWHDGSNIRATITGSFWGNGTLDLAYVFSDGLTQTASMTSNGTTKNVLLTSVLGSSVVRATAKFTPVEDSNCPLGAWYDPTAKSCSGGTPPFTRSWTGFVGDAPDSHGACDQLDSDEMNLQQNGFATFFGNVVYGCTSNGAVTSSVHGTLYWGSQAIGSSARVEAVFTYADHKDVVTISRTSVSASSPQTDVSLGSLSTSNVRSVRVIVRNDNVDGPAATVKFGDA